MKLADKPIAKARLYATALGLYELRINGRRVGDYVLAPDWTDYRKRVRYQVYDVGDAAASPGENAAGRPAGQRLVLRPHRQRRVPGVRQDAGPAGPARSDLRRRQHAADRHRRERGRSMPARSLGLRFHAGRSRTTPGGRCPVGTSRAWTTPRGRRPPSRDEPARRAGRPGDGAGPRDWPNCRPRRSAQPKPGCWIFDLGQNMVGVVRLKVSAPAGTKLTLRHARNAQSRRHDLYRPISAAPRRSTPTCARGGGVEVWQPTFTFHGFRYVELTGLPGKPGPG